MCVAPTCKVKVSSRGSTVLMDANTLAQCLSFSAVLRIAATTGSNSLYSSTAALSLGTSRLGGRPRSIHDTALWNLQRRGAVSCLRIHAYTSTACRLHSAKWPC